MVNIKSINEVKNAEKVTITLSKEDIVKFLHFANFGARTMEAIGEVYKGNKQDLDLKISREVSNGIKDQLELVDDEGRYLKTSNLVITD